MQLNKSINRSAKNSSEPYLLSKITCLWTKSSKNDGESLLLSDKSLAFLNEFSPINEGAGHHCPMI